MKNNHLQLLNKGRNETRLFVIPGIGGRCEGFRHLAGSFGGECTVYGLHMMGSQHQETPLDTIGKIAEKNIAWIQELQPHGPYYLIGHSFGAHVVYEMVRQLESEGAGVAFAAILDESAHLDRMFPGKEQEVEFVMKLTSDYYRSFHIVSAPRPDWGKDLRSRLSDKPAKEMAACIDGFMKQKMERKARIIDLVSRLINLRIYNAHMCYHPQGSVRTELIIFKAAAEEQQQQDDSLGWGPYAEKTTVVEVPGNHISILMHQHSRHIAEHLLEKIKH